jgi:hypothetical protein
VTWGSWRRANDGGGSSDGSVTGPVVAAIGRLFVVVSDDREYELVALE